MTDSVMFFTHNLKPGEIARFDVQTEVFGWQHVFRGVIIQSQRDGCPAVLWPKGAMQHFPHTPTRESTNYAEQIILRKFREWSQK